MKSAEPASTAFAPTGGPITGAQSRKCKYCASSSELARRVNVWTCDTPESITIGDELISSITQLDLDTILVCSFTVYYNARDRRDHLAH